jgi:hypothetical protein
VEYENASKGSYRARELSEVVSPAKPELLQGMMEEGAAAGPAAAGLGPSGRPIVGECPL